jgi:hypothetical protein
MRRILAPLLLAVFVCAASAAQAAPGGVPGTPGAEVSPATHHDHSKPLRDIAPAKRTEKEKEEKRVKELPLLTDGVLDPVVQLSAGAASAPIAGAGFEGVGQGFRGPQGTFSVNSAPPDTNGAVGPNDFVQIVNQSFAVFDKSGTVRYGPAPTNTLWSGFGGGCQSNDDGDATVEYDRLADRWIISQFSVSTSPYLQCVAVSQTGDPTGAYNRYSFSYGTTAFPDYPKLGVWPDGYYTTFNIFNNGVTFAGPKICAYDRAKMIAGQAATQQCFQLSTAYGGLLPSDVDSATPPPAGAPNYLMDFTTNALEMWQFHVDWTTPANSTLSGTPTQIPVAGFTGACNFGGTCIPQGSTTQKLDSLADRLMYRLAYRNFGDHESLVVNHSVTAGTATGVRWYELRNPSAPTVYQQGTYAPNDGASRWMGSAAMDGNGDIAIGFSTSSSSTFPSLRYTGRLVGDPLDVMTQGEATLMSGSGSQTGGLDRWGDYSSLAIDPADDCTFWFTSEYLAATGSFNWHTRIGSFRLPGCNAPAPTPDYSLAVSPSSQSAVQGQSAGYSVTVSASNGFADPVVLSASGLPSGASASFVPSSVSGSGTSALTVATDASLAPGSYPFTITGTSGTLTHSIPATLVVTSATPPDFSISATPSSQTVRRGNSVNYTVTITPQNGFSGSVSLSASGLPKRVSASFTPSSTTSSSTMKVTTNRNSSTGTSTLTIRGVSGSLSHTTTVQLTVQ